MHGLVLGANREISLAVVQTLVTHGFRVGFHQLLHLPAALDHLRRTAYDALIYICHSKTASLNAQPSLHSCANCPIRLLCATGLRLPILTIAERGPNWPGCLNAGANAYMAGFDDEEFLAAQYRAMLSHIGSPLSVLRVAGLTLDLFTLTAYRGDKVIKLTAQEYQFLVLLMSRPGHVFTREQILIHAWQAHPDNDTNAVEMCVCQLREKLDQGCDERLILTERGVGYYFRAESSAA